MTASPAVAGTALGALGVLLFSFTFPATKFALRGFDPWAIGCGRAVVAAALAAPTLVLLRARRPSGADWGRFSVVVGGVVLGFPIFSTLALHSTSSSHAAVVTGVLPAATAVVGALRAHERPSRLFWLAAAAGAALVTGYALVRAGGEVRLGDAYLVAALLVCAIGYAEGALLSRRLGARETICWALVLALPVTVPVSAAHLPTTAPSGAAWAGFAYVAVCSMFLGFFAWYSGLARGGLARVSQVQLMQTPLVLLWSAVILGEIVGWSTALVALGAMAAVAVTQRARAPA